MVTQMTKQWARFLATIGSLALLIVLSTVLAGCSCSSQQPTPAIQLPEVDRTRVYQLLVDESGAQWVADLESYNAAVEKGTPLQAYAVGSESETPKVISGKATPVAIIAADPSALGRNEVTSSTSTKPQAAVFTASAVVTTAALNELLPTDPAYNSDEFMAQFLKIWQQKHPELNIVPSSIVGTASATRAQQASGSLSHKGSDAYIGNNGLASNVVNGENLASTWADITPEELYAIWEASPAHNYWLTASGFDAVYFGLGFSVDDRGNLIVSLNTYNSVPDHPATNPDEQKNVNPPTWYTAPTDDKKNSNSDNDESDQDESEPVAEPDPVEIDPVGVANPSDVIEGIDDEDLPIGWDSETPVVIDEEVATDIQVSPGFEPPLVVGDDTYVVSPSEPGVNDGEWADNFDLVESVIPTEPEDVAEYQPVVEPPFGGSTINLSDAWKIQVTELIQSYIDSGDFDGAQAIKDRIQDHLDSVVGEDVLGGVLAERQTAIDEARAAAAAAAEAARQAEEAANAYTPAPPQNGGGWTPAPPSGGDGNSGGGGNTGGGSGGGHEVWWCFTENVQCNGPDDPNHAGHSIGTTWLND
jgi:hypothetical protein